MAHTTLRIPNEIHKRVAVAAKERGFSSSAGFIRAAITDALDRQESQKDIAALEERIAATLEEGVTRVIRGQQASIAMIDALAKLGSIDHDEFLRVAAAGLNGPIAKAVGSGRG